MQLAPDPDEGLQLSTHSPEDRPSVCLLPLVVALRTERAKLHAALHDASRAGTPERESQIADLVAAGRALKALTALSVESDRATCDRIIELLVQANLSREATKRISSAGEGLRVTDADVVSVHARVASLALEACDLQLRGSAFLQRIIRTGCERLTSNFKYSPNLGNTTSADLLALRGVATTRAGKTLVPNGLSTLLFFCLKCDMQKTKQVVQAQVARLVADPSSDPFRWLGRFLGVFSDITKALEERCPAGETIRERSERALAQILGAPVMQTVDSSVPNDVLFQLLRAKLSEDEDEHPWVVADLSKTPFDRKKIGYLITQDVHRNAAICVLHGLNNNEQWPRVRALQKLLKQAHKQRGASPRLRRRLVTLAIALGLADSVSLEASSADPLSAQLLASWESRLEELNDPLTTPIEIPRFGRNKLNPALLLLRLLHPAKIARSVPEDPVITSQLRGIVRAIRKGESVRDDHDRALLMKSIQMLMETRDPCLHVPISLRGRLTSLWDVMYDVVLRRGSASDWKNRMWFPDDREEASLHEGFDPKDFNTAAFGHRRQWVQHTARRMISEGVIDYPGALNFLQVAASAYFEGPAGGHGRYNFYFYPNATIGFREILKARASARPAEDHIVISNQEYAHMLRDLTHGAAKKSVRAVYLNVESDEAVAPKSGSEVLADLLSCFGRNTRLLVLSSVTRYGDMLGAERETIQRLVREVHREHPQIDIVVDDVQRLGRDTPTTLTPHADGEEIPVHVILGGVAKELGAGQGAVVGLERRFEASIEFEYNPSSNDLQQIVAASLALRLAASSRATAHKAEIPELQARGSLKRVRNDLRAQSQLAELSEHILRQADMHAVGVLRGLSRSEANQLSASGLDAASILDVLGCHVVYPVHRNQAAYHGIVTLTFPNVAGDAMIKGLVLRGFNAQGCLYGNNGVRISCGHKHTTSDIDDLFDAFREVHTEHLKQLCFAGQIKRLSRNDRTILKARFRPIH